MSPTAAQKPAKKSDPANRRRVYLIDGSGYIFRAYHALPPLTRKRDKLPVGAVVGFANMLNKLLEDHFVTGEGTHIAVIFDKGAESFRNDIYDQYKANRAETPEDLAPQFAYIREATRAFNVPVVEEAGFEADDIIATYVRVAREHGDEVVIVSSDKDLMQLVGGHVTMFDPMKSRPIGPDEVQEKFGVGPDRVIDVQSLAGDSVDNVPGVPGIGIKTAALLINEYGDLDTLLARAGEIKQNKRRESLIEFADQARLSRDLVTLREDCAVDHALDDFTFKTPDVDALLAFLDDMEFTAIAKRVRVKFGVDGETAPPPPAAAVAPDKTVTTALTDEAALHQWIDHARARGRVAIVTHTAAGHPVRDPLVGIGLAVDPGTAAWVPMRNPTERQRDLLDGPGEDGPGLPRDTVLAALKPLLEDAAVLKIGQDVKRAAIALGRYGIALGPVDDTMILSYDLEGGLHAHDLGRIAAEYLDRPVTEMKTLLGTGKAAVTFGAVALDQATAFAGEEADTALRLHGVLKPRLVPSRVVAVYETLDRPIVPVLAAMERAGIKADPKTLHAMSKDFEGRLADLEKQIHKLAGRDFNVGSPKQLGEILFEDMGLEGGKKGKGGAWGTGADVLENLAGQGIDLAERVLDWRQISKLKNTYTDKLPGEINPETGRIHTTYDIAVANTGRLSSNDPNLQNIPVRTEEGRKIRQAFVADKGHVLLSADYSQIELRLLAHMADIPQLDKAFKDGIDIHAMTASEVFGVPVEGMNPSVRRRAKAINFGIIYGISAFGLARQLKIPQGEARDYIAAYFERFPGIRGYMDQQKELCRAQGYVTTLFGRRIHLPAIAEKNPVHRAFAERQAINAPLQGAAADIIKRAMIVLPGALAQAKLNAKMLLQVHDELVFEVPEAQADDTRALVKNVMEHAASAVHLTVPLVVEAGTGQNWDEAH
ncbi:MAG: DNA polymerase I [Alphaproteobacteria bacterium]